MKINQFTKSTAPITVIINISNPVAVKLARILLEQGSKILIVDKLNFARRRLLGDLLRHPNCMFMDSESTFKNIDKFKKIDYVYYFLSQLVAGSTYPNLFSENMDISKLSHKNFIRESNRIDAYLKLALEFNASVTVVTSAYLSQFLENIPELNVQLQKYAESLTEEYAQKNKLDARIIRLGELIGEEGDASAPTNISRLLREIILRGTINIFGDGLQQNYLVHTEDAVYALLKATFAKKARGKTFIAAYSHPFTSLSLAYQLLELTTDEKEVVFNKVLPDYKQILKLRDMCLAPSVTSLGWEPQISLEQGLAESLSSLAKIFNQPWKTISKATADIKVTKEAGVTDDDSIGTLSVNKGSRQITTGFRGFLYKTYRTWVAEPILWLINRPRHIKAKANDVGDQVKKISGKWIFILITALLFVWILTPYIDMAISGVRLVRMAKQIERDVASLNTEAFDKYSRDVPILLNSMNSDYQQIGYWQNIPGLEKQYVEIGSMLQAYSLYGKSTSTALRASAPAIEIVKAMSVVIPNSPAGQAAKDYYKEIEELMMYQTDIVQAAQDAQVAELRLSRIDKDNIPSFLESNFEKSEEVLGIYTDAVTELSNYYDIIPYLLGYKDRRTYFLAMQNETELRSTGGWFTAYAILGVENGQIRELTVDDVYNIDGQITGLDAPADMKKSGILSASNTKYKLSLSNWNPEMEEVSKDISALLDQKGLYRPNDITITSTFHVIQKLLLVVGGVDTADLGLVTASNLHDKVGDLHADFVPSSQAKVDSVSDFMPKLLEKLLSAPLEEKREIVEVLIKAVEERDIMIYSAEPILRTNLLDEFDAYRKIELASEPIYIVDWNAGGNKVNKYVKRVTDIVINEKESIAEISVTYNNESTRAEDYKMGIYKNVQRIYFPKSFSIVSYDGYTQVPRTFTTSKSVPYVLGRMEVGIMSAKSTIMGFKMNSVPSILTIMKQPGIESETVQVKGLLKQQMSGLKLTTGPQI